MKVWRRTGAGVRRRRFCEALILVIVMAKPSVLVASTEEERPTQVVRMLVLEHTSARDVSTLLAQIFELERTATVGDEERLLLVRGPAARIEAAAAVVRAIDQPPAEVELDVELLLIPAEDFETVAGALSPTGSAGGWPSRLAADQLVRLRGSARSLARPGLSTLDRDRARWHVLEERFVGGDELAAVSGGLALTVRPRVHSQGEVTLEVTATWTDGRAADPARDVKPRSESEEEPDRRSVDPAASDSSASTDAPATDREAIRERLRQRLRSLPRRSDRGEKAQIDFEASTRVGEWQGRLKPGETLLVSGLLPAADQRGMIAAELLEGAIDGELLLAVTPRVTRGHGLPEDVLEIVCTDVEGWAGLCESSAPDEP